MLRCCEGGSRGLEHRLCGDKMLIGGEFANTCASAMAAAPSTLLKGDDMIQICWGSCFVAPMGEIGHAFIAQTHLNMRQNLWKEPDCQDG